MGISSIPACIVGRNWTTKRTVQVIGPKLFTLFMALSYKHSCPFYLYHNNSLVPPHDTNELARKGTTGDPVYLDYLAYPNVYKTYNPDPYERPSVQMLPAPLRCEQSQHGCSMPPATLRLVVSWWTSMTPLHFLGRIFHAPRSQLWGRLLRRPCCRGLLFTMDSIHRITINSPMGEQVPVSLFQRSSRQPWNQVR